MNLSQSLSIIIFIIFALAITTLGIDLLIRYAGLFIFDKYCI